MELVKLILLISTPYIIAFLVCLIRELISYHKRPLE
jgi:hypothetical protein